MWRGRKEGSSYRYVPWAQNPKSLCWRQTCGVRGRNCACRAWRSADDADVDAPLQPPRHVRATASQRMASIIPPQIHVPN